MMMVELRDFLSQTLQMFSSVNEASGFASGNLADGWQLLW
jgi:hypothetical protein